jgi:hypothetical protein
VGAVKCTLLVLVSQLLAVASAPAQRQASHRIRWWEAAITVGTIGAVSVFEGR